MEIDFEKVLRAAIKHDNNALTQIVSLFVKKMYKECVLAGQADDEDLQAYMLMRFVQDVYEFDIDRALEIIEYGKEISK